MILRSTHLWTKEGGALMKTPSVPNTMMKLHHMQLVPFSFVGPCPLDSLQLVNQSYPIPCGADVHIAVDSSPAGDGPALGPYFYPVSLRKEESDVRFRPSHLTPAFPSPCLISILF